MADKKLSELVAAVTLAPTDLLYVAQSGQAKKLAASVLWNTLSNVTISNKLKIANEQVMQIPGTITANTTLTKLSTTGSTGNLTIAVGEEGQIKIVVMTTKSNNGFYRLNTGLAGNASILFDAVGKTATLLYTSNSWHIIGGTATVTTP